MKQTIILEVEIEVDERPDKESMAAIADNIRDTVQSEPGVSNVYVEEYD